MARALESWRLFWVLALVIMTADLLGLPFADFHSFRGTEFIILHAVLCALPFFLVAFTASSLATLWPSRRTRWVLANRRYFGLAFAFGMAWHFTFVGYSVIRFGNRLGPSDLTLDSIGLCLLLAMTLTSFRRFSRRVTLVNWRRLHKAGVYTIWFLVTYFYLDDFRSNGNRFYLGVAGLFLAAWVLRMIAWIRKRRGTRQVALEVPAQGKGAL